MSARIIEFTQDYAFRPVLPVFSGIPDQFHAGLLGGTLILVRRQAPADRWGLVPAECCPHPGGAWPGHAVLQWLEAVPDTALFVLQEPAPRRTGLPDWSRYRLDLVRLARQRKRLVAAERAACWFNCQAGVERHRVDNLSDAAVLVLALAKAPSACIWMYRSLATPVLELVRAGHGAVLPEGRFVPHASAVAVACQVRTRRHICLQWVRPASIDQRLAAWRRKPRPPGAEVPPPVLAYPIE